MMTLDKKVFLNKFICKLNIFGSPKGYFINELGQKIEKPTVYIRKCFQNTFKREISINEMAYIISMLELDYDFENIPYRVYLNRFVEMQNNKMVKDLKTSYDNYLESIANLSNSKTCIYISGQSGSGKTTYAKILASKYYNNDEIYITSGGGNPFDEYYGEKCIIIDDFRDSVLSYNDLLRLLDNHTSSSVGARYHNKNLARCELIILTSVKTPLELYKGIDEERFQLYRRIEFIAVENQKITLIDIDKNGKLTPLENKDVSYEFIKYYHENKPTNKFNILELFAKEQKSESEPESESESETINFDELPF